MSEQLRNEPHKQPPHEKRMGLGVALYTRTCPSCGEEVLVLLYEFKDSKLVRRFCHLCAESKANEGMHLVR